MLKLTLSRPNIVKMLFSFLCEVDAEIFILFIKSITSNKIVNKSLDISFSIIFRGELPKFLEIKDIFGISSARCGRASVKDMSVASVAGEPDYLCENKILEERYDLGFIVLIPIPLLNDYSYGSDRDPLFITRSYCEASKNIDGGQCSLRVILSLNVKDDVFDTVIKSDVLSFRVAKFAKKWNKLLDLNGYKASVVPVKWGFSHYESDLIREFLSCVENVGRHANMSFPFASIRSHLLQTNIYRLMVKDLERSCKKIYCKTGDADLVSLSSSGESASVIEYAAKHIKDSKLTLIRYGGNTSFSNDEIFHHLKSIDVTRLDYLKSILLTQLCHSTDFAFRKILADIDISLAYFSEIGTFIAKDFISSDNIYCKESMLSYLSNSKNTVNNDGGDLMCMLSRIIRAQHLQAQQLFQVNPDASVITSARHELVVACSDEGPVSGGKHGCFSHLQFVKDSISIEKVKEIFSGLKNMQLTPSQVNGRFSNAGYNTSSFSFHDLIGLFSMSYVPFSIYFLTRMAVPKDKDATGFCQRRLQKSLEEAKKITINPLKEEVLDCNDILKEFRSVTIDPANAAVKFPVKVSRRCAKKIQSKKFSLIANTIAEKFALIESLLRWNFFQAKRIMISDLEVKPGFLDPENSKSIQTYIDSENLSKFVDNELSFVAAKMKV